MNEFEIIQNFFRRTDTQQDSSVLLGIGDDAAVIEVPANCHLVVCMDTLISGVHFPVDTLPADIAYKSLAVNLSDMAAMGAEPRWITLSVTVPQHDDGWFEAFANSFHKLASAHSLALVGGDLSRGPLSVTVQLQGIVPAMKNLKTAVLTRSGARPGDSIYVTGCLGAAAYALKTCQQPDQGWAPATAEELLRLQRPAARLETGKRLRGFASSCIDISDGLHADLMHVLEASQAGADVELARIPLSASLEKLDASLAFELALTGGDDYELCFTLPANTPVETIKSLQAICPVTRIGTINDLSGDLLLKDANGNPYFPSASAYRHF